MDHVQQLLTPLKRLKTTEEAKPAATVSAEPLKITNKTSYTVKVTGELLARTIFDQSNAFRFTMQRTKSC